MADDPERDLIPTRDGRGSQRSHCVAYTICSDVQSIDRPTVSDKKIAEQLSRNDFEDQLYQLRDQNLELKKNSRKQEEQIKKLITRMTRIVNEKKKIDVNSSPARKRDLELEEALEELNDKVRNLERSNVQLREKLLVAKQQVITQTRRPNAYNYVPPRVNTNRPRSGVTSYPAAANLRGVNNQRGNLSAPLPSYVVQLLDEARSELFSLKELVTSQRHEMDGYEEEIELYKERLRIKDSEFDVEINHLKSQITEGQRHHVQENLDLIRLHRELKQKDSKITALQAQITDKEEKLRTQRLQQDHLMKEIDEKSLQNQEEQKRSLQFLTELQEHKAELHSLTSLQESFKSLKKENEVLKDTNDKLIKSVLGHERERTINSSEQVLKERISQLESNLSSIIKEKGALEEDVKFEKDRYYKLNDDYEKMQTEFKDVKQCKEEYEAKLNILNNDEVDFDELGEALALVKLKKQRSININFLQKLPEEEEEDLRSALRKSEKDHSDTIKEFCSVREMLMTQYKINQDIQEELKTLSGKCEQCEKEYQVKLQEYANLLDIRSAKIQKLERQLNDIAYGTKKVRIEEFQQQVDIIETMDLDRGENLFEIHIIKFVYSEDGTKFLNNKSPSSFLTWQFYEFELQSTPVINGMNAQFACSAQYRVNIDDFFLFYLHKNTTTLELHQSLGTDYRTVAACQLSFSELLDQAHGRLHGTQKLISVCDQAVGVVFGTVHYWIKLHMPIEEAFKLYKQKFKALKYIQGNSIASNAAIKLLEQPVQKETSTNDLHVKILRCRNLKGNIKGMQPSAFCVYKFYNHADKDTIIIPASNNPEYNDHQTFSISTDSDFERFLRTESLNVYVFDDNDPDLTSYIGFAIVPLVPLSLGKPVKGLFELRKEGLDENFGSIEISIYWQQTYQSSSSEISLPAVLDKTIEYPSHIVPMATVFLDDDDVTESESNILMEPFMKEIRRKNKPTRTSTPVKAIANRSSSSSISISSDSSPNIAQKLEKPKSSKSGSSRKASVSSLSQKSTPKRTKSYNSPINDLEDQDIFESTLRSPSMKSSLSPEDRVAFKQALENVLSKRKDEDTISERKQEISFEEISDDDKQALSDSDLSTVSELKPTTTSPGATSAAESNTIPSIVIGIHKLSLEEDASVLNDPSIQMLYVEYKFLDYPLEDLETPYSLPKPIPPEFITYQYEKAFPFHPEENVEKFKLLAQMFNPNTPESSWIKFTVVSEPPSDEDGKECEDVGYAYIDLREIMKRGRDIMEESIEVFDAKEMETCIGELTVTIQALKVLSFL